VEAKNFVTEDAEVLAEAADEVLVSDFLVAVVIRVALWTEGLSGQ